MPSSFEIAFAKFQVSSKVRLRLYKKIAGLLSNGVSLQAALDVLWDQAAKGGKRKGDPVAVAIDSWRQAYRNGRPFGQALEGWAPLGERMLVEAGESGSRLDEALLNVIKLAESSQAIKGALIGGLSYPGILLVMLGGMLYLFGVQVIPNFGALLPPEQWTGLAAGMRVMSIIANNWLVPIAIGFFVFIIVFTITAPRW
ncbi:MAG: type II secretion system F family protein, partial [Pseudomonadota bacterium]